MVRLLIVTNKHADLTHDAKPIVLATQQPKLVKFNYTHQFTQFNPLLPTTTDQQPNTAGKLGHFSKTNGFEDYVNAIYCFILSLSLTLYKYMNKELMNKMSEIVLQPQKKINQAELSQ